MDVGSNYLYIHKLEVWEWMNNFIPYFMIDVIMSTLGLEVIHVNKGSQCRAIIKTNDDLDHWLRYLCIIGSQ